MANPPKGSFMDVINRAPIVPYDDANDALAIERASQSTAGQAVSLDPSLPEAAEIPILTADGDYKKVTHKDALLTQMVGGRILDPKEQEQQETIAKARRDFEGSLGGMAGAAGYGALAELIPIVGPKMAKAILESKGMSPEQAELELQAALQTTAGKVGAFAGSIAPMLATEGGASLLLGAEQAAKQAGAAAVKEGLKKTVARELLSNAAYGALSAANESEIAGKPITAEDMLHGGVLGGALGVGMGVPLRLLSNKFLKRAAPEIKQFVDTELAADVTELEALKRRGFKPVYTGAEAQVGGLKLPGFANEMAKKSGAAGGATLRDIEAVATGESTQNAENRFLAQNHDEIFKEAGEQLVESFGQHAKQTKDFVDGMFQEGKAELLDAMAQRNGVTMAAAHQNVIPFVAEYQGLQQEIKQAWKQGLLRRETAARLLRTEFSDAALTRFQRELKTAKTAGDVIKLADDFRQNVQTGVARLQTALEKGKPWINDAELKTVRELADKRANNLYNMQRNKAMWGNMADDLDMLYGLQSDSLAMRENLAVNGLLRRGEKDLEDKLGRKLLNFNLESIVSALKNPNNPASQQKIAALMGYIKNSSETSMKLADILGSNQAQAAHQVFNDINTVIGFNARLMEKSASMRDALTSFRNAGINPMEAVARTGLGAIGSIYGGVKGGLASYALGHAGGYISNPGKLYAAKIMVENSQRLAEANRLKTAQKLAAGKLVPPVGTIIDRTNYNAVSQGIHDALANSNKFSQAITSTLGTAVELAPKMTMDVQLKAQQALQILADATKPPMVDNNVLQPQFAMKIPPSDEQIRKANLTAMAVFHPELVYSHPTRLGVQVVKVLYPEYHADMLGKISMAMANAKKPMDFNMRQYMSFVFDMKTDTIQDPAKWALIQGSLSVQAGKQQGGQMNMHTSEQLMSDRQVAEAGGSGKM